MSLVATNVADVGSHSMVLTIVMANYPTITLTKNFSTTIYVCVVTTLTFTTVPAALTTLKYSDSAVDLTFVTT